MRCALGRVLVLGVVVGGVGFAVGCGGSAPGDDAAGAGRAAGASADAAAVGGGSVAGEAGQSTGGAGGLQEAAAGAPAIAAATAEQIARWTPAAVEPLRLMAVHEWETTSFTTAIAATPDGKHFLVAGSRVLLWALGGEEPEHVFLDVDPDDSDRSMLSLAVAPNGKWFAVGDSEGVLRAWSLEDRREIATKDLKSNGVAGLAISPDSREIATIAYDSEVATWDVETFAPRKTFDVDTSGVKRIAYLADGQLAAAGETTAVWNTATGAKVRELSPGRYSFALARSADGSRMVSGSDDALVVWNVAEAKEETRIEQGVTGGELVAFSPDGKFLATSDGRGYQVWNLAERRVVQAVDGFGWVIAGLAWLPETNLLAVASDIGITRLWGTAAAGEAAGLKPLEGPVAMPGEGSLAPATTEQLAEVINLRTLPTLPGSVASIWGRETYSATVTVSSDEARTFYHHFLTQAGWTPAPGPAPNPAALEYRKGGFPLTVSCYDAGDGKLQVMVDVGDNYDVRQAPKFDGAPVESVYEFANTVAYRTKGALVDIETQLLRKMHAAGWTAYTRLKSSHSEDPERRDLSFLAGGITLQASIGTFPEAPGAAVADGAAEPVVGAGAGAEPTTWTVQYSTSVNDTSAPVPPDAGFVEFDGSTDPTLVAISAMTLDEARAFYDAQMAARGWMARGHGRSEKDEQQWLAYLRGQCDMSVGLTKLPDGRTLVRIGDTGGSLWEASQAEEEPAAAEAGSGLEAADFPVLNATKTAKYEELQETIEVAIPGASLAETAERYAAALAELGWTLEEGGIRDEEYTMVDFAKGEQEITLRARVQEGAAVLSFEGDGLLWTKELPGGKQVVSYETWLRQYRLPPGLEWLERYEGEMRAIGGR